MNKKEVEYLIERFSEYVTENKKQKFEAVLSLRTRYLTVVLEDIYHSQNASAVMRSCEAMGLQNIHFIENQHEYKLNKGVVRGAYKWMHIFRHQSTEEAIKLLKADGYKIAITSPHSQSIPITELPLAHKIALVFGTELTGVSELMTQHADYHVFIPMYGFSESFNLSVSAGICLQELIPKLHQTSYPWHLTSEEQLELTLEWMKKSVRNPLKLEKLFLSDLRKL